MPNNQESSKDRAQTFASLVALSGSVLDPLKMMMRARIVHKIKKITHNPDYHLHKTVSDRISSVRGFSRLTVTLTATGNHSQS